VLNGDARGSVGADLEGAEFPWKPKLVTDVDEACDGINDTPTLVLLMEEAGDQWDDLTAAMKAVAKEVRNAEEERGEESWRRGGDPCRHAHPRHRIQVRDAAFMSPHFSDLNVSTFYGMSWRVVVVGGVSRRKRDLRLS